MHGKYHFSYSFDEDEQWDASKIEDGNCKNEMTNKMYEDCMTIMGMKYGREWEPVYQAFLPHPLAQEVLASPERDKT